MPSQNFKNMPLRPWIAPALGAGLLLAGVAMAVGMSSAYGPLVAVAVAAVILLIGHRRTTRADRVSARKPVI
jgi:Flp pilus assembly protein TadB